MRNLPRSTGSRKPLTNWDVLLANCEARAQQFFHLTQFHPINCMMGDTFRPTVTYSDMGIVLQLSFEMLCITSISAVALFITEEGLAHIGIVDVYTREQLWYELPSVWQYHDREDDDALSIPERREQKVSFMYALAGM